jgi:hypothetical protein
MSFRSLLCFSFSFYVFYYSFYVCFIVLHIVFCVFVLFCVLFLLIYIVISFLFVYKYTDHCRRVETQLQLQVINVISCHNSRNSDVLRNIVWETLRYTKSQCQYRNRQSLISVIWSLMGTDLSHTNDKLFASSGHRQLRIRVLLLSVPVRDVLELIAVLPCQKHARLLVQLSSCSSLRYAEYKCK